MCGRYRRKSDKQRIANAFEVTAGLDALDFGPEDDIDSRYRALTQEWSYLWLSV